MMLALSQGDAYGGVFEYATDSFVAAFNDPSKGFVPRGGDPTGRYTDDTQMSLAVAEALISGEPWTPLLLARHFVMAFKRDERKGYASRFYRFLKEINDADQFLALINSGSDKSGGAMRAAPIGVLPNIGEVIKKSRIQAAITHNTTDGMNAAIASSLLSHYFVHDLGPKSDVGIFINDYVAGQWSIPWIGDVGEKGWQSVRAAITAVIESHGMTELLKKCIAYTGDVDTVASVALAAGSHSKEIDQDLSQAFFDGLENGPYGRDYLIDIDRQLMKLRGKDEQDHEQ